MSLSTQNAAGALICNLENYSGRRANIPRKWRVQSTDKPAARTCPIAGTRMAGTPIAGMPTAK
jgi:hypothetical protein